MPNIVHFGEFLKTWSLRSNSVTRHVDFLKGQKLVENAKMRHFGWFSNTVYAKSSRRLSNPRPKIRTKIEIPENCETKIMFFLGLFSWLSSTILNQVMLLGSINLRFLATSLKIRSQNEKKNNWAFFASLLWLSDVVALVKAGQGMQIWIFDV